MGALSSLYPGEAISEMWRERPHAQARNILPPPAMGRHGMNKSVHEDQVHPRRALGCRRLLARGDPKPWRFSTLVETLFNEQYLDVIPPG
eukprot:3418690-Pleurochrysis_carterae.AAC.3